MSQEIKNIAEAIQQAVPVEKIYLFGSHAYGTPRRDSDYDFYIIIPEGSMRQIEAMQKAQMALCAFGSSIPAVDVKASTQRKFDIMRNRVSAVEKEVARRGVILYERHGMAAQMARTRPE